MKEYTPLELLRSNRENDMSAIRAYDNDIRRLQGFISEKRKSIEKLDEAIAALEKAMIE